jgi:hypothetical protein
LFGIHLLRRTPTGIEAVRIVREESEGDDEHLKSGAGRWQELLGDGTVSGVLLARESREKGKARLWTDVEREVASEGIAPEVAWIPVTVCRNVPDAVERLT